MRASTLAPLFSDEKKMMYPLKTLLRTLLLPQITRMYYGNQAVLDQIRSNHIRACRADIMEKAGRGRGSSTLFKRIAALSQTL